MNKNILALLVTTCLTACAMEQTSNVNSTQEQLDHTFALRNEYSAFQEKYLKGKSLQEQHQIVLSMLYNMLKTEQTSEEAIQTNNNDNQVAASNDVIPAVPPAGTNDEVDEVFQDLSEQIVVQPGTLQHNAQQRHKKCCVSCTII